MMKLFLCLCGLLSGVRVRAEESPPRIVHHPSDVVVKAGSPATLSCRVDGSPKPAIQWLRNGQHVEVSRPDGRLQPLVLSEGSLFFLSVQPGRSHEGVYACLASNVHGKAVSRNASLFIAALQEEFIVQPSDVEVAEGEVAVLNCTPPQGHPEPNVIWKLNGVPINTTDQHFTELSGRLIVAPAEKQHSGSYVCVASNTVGARQSRAARLSVLARPVLLIRPENVSVRPGESAEFSCRAKGDPPPTVVWSREQGPLPNGRYLVNPDNTLQIHYVTAKDSGRYTCTVVNDVGMVSVSAQLLVEEAEDLEQRDLHRELSAIRVSLDNVSIEAPGSKMSLVQWKLLALPAQPHFLDGFEVLHRSLLPASSDWRPQNVSLPGLQARVGPLQRGYKYEFKVRPYGGGLYGRESNTRHLRVPETVPSAAPLAVSITVNHQLNNSIRLSWQAPPHDTHNGIIQGYQVWCVDSEQQLFQNWTLDSSRHVLDITSLVPGRRYWLSMAAVNGAGVGELSEPHGFVINPQLGGVPDPDSRRGGLSPVLGLLQDPVLIGCVGALLSCVLMVAAVYLVRRRCGSGRLLPVSRKNHGLRRLASEDLIIKHRMAAPDSPWISGSWRPAFSHKYQDLWAQRHNHPGLRSSSLPVSSKTDSSYLESAVPIVTDSCGVYGTFYVDLRGSNLKTFNSPGRSPKKPHGFPPQQGGECIQIFTPPISKSSPPCSRDALPWKQAIRPQPRMGVLRESWEKNFTKQELHAVNSVPLLSRTQTCPQSLYTQRLSHVPAGRNDCEGKATGRPRLLQYSASLQLLDMLPPPPPSPPVSIDDAHSLSSDEGSSRSTKLTVDMGSIQSVCLPSGRHVQPVITSDPHSNHLPSTCCPTPHDHEQDSTLTSQDATEYLERSPTEYLELSPRPERCSMLPEERSPLSQHMAPARGYRIGPVVEDKEEEVHVDLRRARLQSTPSSYYSDWDGSLWNTWSSVMGGNLDSSARTSLISSVDSCYTCDSSTCDSSTFSRLLAAAAESLSGASLSDFSPPASPLSLGGLYPPSFPPDRAWSGGPEPLPAWDWGTAWMEEMEAQYRARCPPASRKPPDTQRPY